MRGKGSGTARRGLQIHTPPGHPDTRSSYTRHISGIPKEGECRVFKVCELLTMLHCCPGSSLNSGRQRVPTKSGLVMQKSTNGRTDMQTAHEHQWETPMTGRNESDLGSSLQYSSNTNRPTGWTDCRGSVSVAAVCTGLGVGLVRHSWGQLMAVERREGGACL